MPRPRSALPAIVCAVGAVAGLLSGCGDSEEKAASGLAAQVPPDAPLYLEVAVFPDDDRSDAIASLADRIAGISDPQEQLASMIDAQFAAQGADLTYADDIEPWLGDTAGAFVRSFEPADVAGGMVDAAYLFDVTDTAGAEAFIETSAESDPQVREEEREYEGATYTVDPTSGTTMGILDGVLILGTEPAFKAAVDAANGDSLADSEGFSEQVGTLDDDAVMEAWVDLGIVLDAAAAQATEADGTEIDAARAALGELLSEPLAAKLEVTEDTIALETTAADSAGIAGNSELLGQMPADAWFAVAISEAGAALQESFDGLGALGAELGDPSLDPEAIASAVESQTGLDLSEDVFSWIDNAAFFVSGTSQSAFRAGGLLETSDTEATGDTIAAARDLFEGQTGTKSQPPQLEGASEGFSATGPDGQGVEVALRDELLVGAFGGPDPATELLETDALADAPLYSAAADALGGDFAASLFVGMQDFLVVAEKGDDGDTDYDAARPYTQALEYLIFGTSSEDGRDRARFVLGVGD